MYVHVNRDESNYPRTKQAAVFLAVSFVISFVSLGCQENTDNVQEQTL